MLFKSLTYSGYSAMTINAFVGNSKYLNKDEILARYIKNISISSGRLQHIFIWGSD